jgi:hexosaminidase
MKKHNWINQTLTAACVVSLLGSCGGPTRHQIVYPQTDLSTTALIPKPLSLKASGAAFGLSQFTGIYTTVQEPEWEAVAQYTATELGATTGLVLPVNPDAATEIHNGIYLMQQDMGGPESYEIRIGRDSVQIQATSAEGIFRGVQTLRQLVPEIANDSLIDYPIWVLAGGNISDRPAWSYRGGMLDVARHFFSVSDVKKYIDIMAYYKMNVLHMHLTDDQGWRIEIKSWPKLTEVGGSTEVGGAAGGFYTQEEYRDIVAYAAARYITIIPEVDMPGHTNAASVSYPVLNGNGKIPELYTGTHVGFSTWDTRKDTVYTFIDDVIREISEMTPGPYFHIGGDESHVTKPQDYIYFIERVAPIVKKYGKTLVGWDEIANAKLDSTAIAQFWADEDNARLAVNQGMKVILSPAKKAYLDMQYDTLSQFGLHWAAYIPVDTAYIWTPETYADGIAPENILGVEAPLWSETISEIGELEYLAFPRLLGYSELSWSTPENRDWENYKVRLGAQTPYFKRMNINYYPSSRVPWKQKDLPAPIRD